MNPLDIKAAVPSWNRAQLAVQALYLNYGTYILNFTAALAGMGLLIDQMFS
jgi:hypothetical protein